MRYHELKIESQYYLDVMLGSKRFEARKNDRNFFVGDILILNEFNKDGIPGKGKLYMKVTYILHGGQFGIEEGYCVMGIVPASAQDLGHIIF